MWPDAIPLPGGVPGMPGTPPGRPGDLSAVSGVIAPQTVNISDGSPPGRGGRGTECPQQGRNHRKPGNRRCRALRSRDTPELSLFRNEHIVHQMFREARISQDLTASRITGRSGTIARTGVTAPRALNTEDPGG